MSSDSQRQFAKREKLDEKENVRPFTVSKKSNIPCLESRRRNIKVHARGLLSDLDRPKIDVERKNEVCPGVSKTPFRVHVDGVESTVSNVCGQRRTHDKGDDVQRKPLRESSIRAKTRSRSASSSRRSCVKHAGHGDVQVRVGPTPKSTKIVSRCPVTEKKPIAKGLAPLNTGAISRGTSSAISSRRLPPSSCSTKSLVRTSAVPAQQRPLPTTSTVKVVKVKVPAVAPKQRATHATVTKEEIESVEVATDPTQRSICASSTKKSLTGHPTLNIPKQRSVSVSPIKHNKDNVSLFDAPKQKSNSMTSLRKKIMSSAVFGISRQRPDPPASVDKRYSEQRAPTISKLKQRSTSTSSLTKEIPNVTIRGTSKQRSNSTEGRFADCYKPTVDKMWYDYLLKMKSTKHVPNALNVKECSIAGQNSAAKEPSKRLLPANNRARIMSMKNPIERLKRQEVITTVLTPVDGLPEPPVPMKVSLRRKIAAKVTQEACTELDFYNHYDDDLLEMEAEKERRSLNLSEDFLRRNINADQRKVLVTFLIHVSSHCGYPASITYQAVKLLDVVIDRISVDTVYLQLLALAVLWITLKREERLPKIPSATSVIALAGELYQGRKELLVNCEKKILMALDFNISFADPMSIFVHCILNCKRKMNFPENSLTTFYYYGSYVIDATLLEVDFCRISPTVLATATAELVLCLTLEFEHNLPRPCWTYWKNMVLDELHESDWYDDAKMRSLKMAMVRCIMRSADRYSGTEVVYKKYRRSTYRRIADNLIYKTKILYFGHR